MVINAKKAAVAVLGGNHPVSSFCLENLGVNAHLSDVYCDKMQMKIPLLHLCVEKFSDESRLQPVFISFEMKCDVSTVSGLPKPHFDQFYLQIFKVKSPQFVSMPVL